MVLIFRNRENWINAFIHHCALLLAQAMHSQSFKLLPMYWPLTPSTSLIATLSVISYQSAIARIKKH